MQQQAAREAAARAQAEALAQAAAQATSNQHAHQLEQLANENIFLAEGLQRDTIRLADMQADATLTFALESYEARIRQNWISFEKNHRTMMARLRGPQLRRDRLFFNCGSGFPAGYRANRNAPRGRPGTGTSTSNSCGSGPAWKPPSL